MIIIKQEQEQMSSCLNPIHNIILINYSLISHGSIVFHKFIIILILHFQILKFQIFSIIVFIFGKKDLNFLLWILRPSNKGRFH